jgi:hypothetical protein
MGGCFLLEYGPAAKDHLSLRLKCSSLVTYCDGSGHEKTSPFGICLEGGQCSAEEEKICFDVDVPASV